MKYSNTVVTGVLIVLGSGYKILLQIKFYENKNVQDEYVIYIYLLDERYLYRNKNLSFRF